MARQVGKPADPALIETPIAGNRVNFFDQVF